MTSQGTEPAAGHEEANPAKGAPRPPSRLAQRWARSLLALFGWTVEADPPPGAKCVIVVYPHTSNWDFFIGYLAKIASGLPLWWVGKHSIFVWPIAGLLRRMGGIPVNRSETTGFIDRLVEEFSRRPRMWLVIAPEGTRSRTDHWKSGFYRLALAAKVPVGLASIDYRERRVELTTYLPMTGNEQVDLDRIRAAYAGKVGKRPGQASDIRFRG
ncbi:MAG TPA: 1-acyl-sn-glycerol-3-phosphate acyltransferase [Anaeromyxobacteraceae bacterium]|nr:1-acyl-sn-glycerol-3-phosphate acyltransferase [Anaeromyxobacteraceae bacterium]